MKNNKARRTENMFSGLQYEIGSLNRAEGYLMLPVKEKHT